MRRAFTLVELIVALALSGVAIAAFALLLADQYRVYRTVAHRVRARGQAIEGLAPLIVDLRAVDPAAGDIPPGGALDSAIEIRALVAAAVVCAVADRAIVAAVESVLAPTKGGDSTWALMRGDSGMTWAPLPVAGTRSLAAGDSVRCPIGPRAPGSAAGERVAHRFELELSGRPPDEIQAGIQLRTTRRTRYSLYRAPDGRSYLGRREFSPVLGRFETVQPVSGPFRPYATVPLGGSGFELRYFDRAGVELPSGTLETVKVARIDIAVRTPPPPSDSPRDRRDVTYLTVAPRGRQ